MDYKAVYERWLAMIEAKVNIPFGKTIETGQVGHFHRADCSVVPPRLVTISGAVVY